MDIDGTIVDHGLHCIHPNTQKTIKALAVDNDLWLCTGRVYNSAQLDLGLSLNNYVCSLGAMIYKDGQIIYERPYHEEEKKELIEEAATLGLEMTYECAEHAYCHDAFIQRIKDRPAQAFETNDDYWLPKREYKGEKIYKMMVEGKHREEYTEFVELFNKRYEFCRSTNKLLYMAEVSPKGVSKGGAIKKLAELGFIDIDKTICIGDSPNDVSMFEVCAYSIAMGQGYDFVKEKATYVTDPIDKDGFYNAFKAIKMVD